MQVLALDTATPFLVLGLPTHERVLRLDRRHAERLFGELEDFLAWAGTSLEELEGIAVGQGPGSYTGLRIGIAAGLGLARGLGVPLVGVDTLAGVAGRYRGTVTVAHATRNGYAYAATYRVDDTVQTLAPPRKQRLEELEPASLDEPPSGRVLARLGVERLRRGEWGVEPLYL
ncbi:tRNA (adenosine(37)-N6)-threonylcarbamoyltransferase complex dimerization subunit type 1 TsaB [Calidithermus chliarophilus]|uniref:tRNA (adenosine(37)-N6)-threonylcarbamoyltransferase complex dimerization subunit type 1 TsaB n=1 Tax=Calidithermus chliarophilus TaxID=52023 RepID=UPI0004190D91|nr:tRNA (adenosine(37)-N6)-threonylcarbamoyltransferase complex dimerization subunit type 1 TsaB [Calidithermus chliarophilus]